MVSPVPTGSPFPAAADGNAAWPVPRAEGRTATVDEIDATSSQTSRIPMASAAHPPRAVRTAGLVRAARPAGRGGVGELTRWLDGGRPKSDGLTPTHPRAIG